MSVLNDLKENDAKVSIILQVRHMLCTYMRKS